VWADPNLGHWNRTNTLIAQAAEQEGAELREIGPVHSDHVALLCKGKRAVRIAKTRSPFLSAVANKLANHKFASGELLRAAGLPVIERVLLDDLDSDDQRAAADAALAAWRRVVVKPNWTNRALGITPRVASSSTLYAALELARSVDPDEEALIEPWVRGENVRVSVVGQTIAAVRIVRPLLRGDGRTPRQLIAQLNEDPRRGEHGDLTPLDQIAMDATLERVLALQGAAIDTPLPAGRSVVLLTEEAETHDVTAVLRPRWADAARRACAVLDIDVGGVDFLLDDPSQDTGVLLEVNCLPALHLHALPTHGDSQPVFRAFVRHCLS